MEEKIIEIIKNDIINLSDKTIKDLYNYWRDETPDKCKNDPKDWIQKKELISEVQQVPKGSFLNGIDFPYWFGKEKSNKKIMIIGIDPMRDEKVFSKLEANKSDDVIIGTPYAVHSKKIRSGRTKEYWEFIEALSEKNFVYLTDIYKTFFYTNETKKTRSYVHHRSINSESARDILKKEIDIINPDIIITLGNETFIKFTLQKLKSPITNAIKDNIVRLNEYDNLPIIPMVHLSGSTYKKHKVKFLENNFACEIDKSFGLSYAEIIEKFLNNNN